MLKENEVINDLLGYDGLKIIQSPEMFNFSLDSTLLANFVSINKNVKNLVDLGTGNAPVPMFLSLRTNAKIIGVEIQEEVYNLAKRNIKLNNLENQISIIHGDMKNIHQEIGYNNYDVVVCNPPFFKLNKDSNINKNDYLTIARHEVKVTLKEMVAEAGTLLNNRGTFAMVHRPDRLVEILEVMQANKIYPKRLRFVYPRFNKEANTILIEGKKSNPGGLRILPPLFIYKDEKSNEYTEEVRNMFMLDKT